MEFLIEMIYKVAIDYAREKDNQEIVELLSKGPIKKKITVDGSKNIGDIESIKQENEILCQKIQKQEEEIQKKDDENKRQAEEINRLKSLLFSLREKVSPLQIVDFQDYEIESVIGEGATSSVKIVSKKEKYAQKELKEITFNQVKQILSECEILFLLHHPCIVRVFGFSHGDNLHAPSIILSLEPTSLEKAIHDKIIEDHHKNRITVEIVLGMRYIHKKKFMHRDLKPSNILLSKNKHVRISDFGLAKDESLEKSQTKGIGTLRFMAPELFDEKPDEDDDNEEEDGEETKPDIRYTNKVDVYSFGMTLIYIVTEKYPAFNLKNAVTGVIPKLKSTIIDWVRELIVRCLSFSPENRPSFAEIFEIMKSHNYDMFNDSKNSKLTNLQRNHKEEIEKRILKIEAFEYQHQEP